MAAFSTFFEVPQMENGWKMEDGKIDSSPLGIARSRGEVRQVPLHKVGISNTSSKRTYGPAWVSGGSTFDLPVIRAQSTGSRLSLGGNQLVLPFV
jgi:hypothetical protein